MPTAKLIEHNGVSLTRQEWSEAIGISLNALEYRLAKYPLDIALETPKNHQLKLRQGFERGEPTKVLYVRVPESLHRVMLDMAATRKVSLNQLCIEALKELPSDQTITEEA